MLLFLCNVSFFFILFLLSLKLLGKSALAQLTPHDFGAIIFLSYLAFQAIPVAGALQAFLGMVVITCLHLLLTKLSLLNKLNRFILGHPIILIKHGDIIFENLQKVDIRSLNCFLTSASQDIQVFMKLSMRY